MTYRRRTHYASDVVVNGDDSPVYRRNTRPVKPPTTPIELVKPVELLEFDYAVIRYSWGKGDGIDLDTRTSIIKPPRNVIVGWGREITDVIDLQWAGDTTEVIGMEGNLFNFKSLISAYPDVNEFEAVLRALWYSHRVRGNFQIGFKSYIGGYMQVTSEHEWENIGGTVVQSLVISCNIDSRGGSTENVGINVGIKVAKLIFNKTTKRGQLVSIDTVYTDDPIAKMSLSSFSGETLFLGTPDNLTLLNSSNEIVYQDE